MRSTLMWVSLLAVANSLLLGALYFLAPSLSLPVFVSFSLVVVTTAMVSLFYRPFGRFQQAASGTSGSPGADPGAIVPRGIECEHYTACVAQTEPVSVALGFVDYTPELLCIKDGDGRMQRASPEYLELYGLAGVDYLWKTDTELTRSRIGREKPLARGVLFEEEAWEKGESVRSVESFNNAAGRRKFEITRTPVFDSKGLRRLMIVTGFDITKREKSKRALQLISTAFECSAQGILLINTQLKIIRVNRAFSMLTGFAADEVQGISFRNMAGEEHGLAFFRTMQKCVDTGGEWHGELTCRRKQGETFFAWFSMVPVKEKGGEVITHYLGTISDITDKKAAEARILRLAHYDDLTGLPNRVMFSERLTQIMSRGKRHGLINVLLFIDLDRFKAINDSLGHLAGDDLLKQSAARLTSILRQEDLVARLGGDEFAVVLENQQSVERASYSASLVAQKIISRLSAPFFVHGNEVFLGASVGIAISPQDGTTTVDLLKHADAAMYHAKKLRRNNYQFFKEELTHSARKKLQMERNLRKALEDNQLRLYYQPQFDAFHGGLCGAEVLVRWQNPQGGLIPPAQFIPVAEESGLIVPMGQWILEQACFKLREWQDQGLPLPRLAVNLSARQFCQPEFVQTVQDLLEKVQLNPWCLEFEITESMLMEDVGRAELMLNRLHKMGTGIAIDDFGTGYSSLAYLKRFPIGVLKIDRSFVQDVTTGTSDAAICCSIIAMAHNLGQKVIAEGVETVEQLDFLVAQGCDMVQGYYFSPPLPEHEMKAMLLRHRDGSAQARSTP